METLVDVVDSDYRHSVAAATEVWESIPLTPIKEYLTAVNNSGPLYHFMVTLIHPNHGEKLVDLMIDSDRFCHVIREVKKAYPGWSIFETWEAKHEVF